MLGVAGHALSNNNSANDNVEVPISLESNLRDNKNIPRYKNISNKGDSAYSQTDNTAKQNSMRQRKIAPPSIKKNRTIYHDKGSGFNFKVSAQSYNKLQDEYYSNVSELAGSGNTTLNVNKDTSKITDNWLANKFADLTE